MPAEPRKPLIVISYAHADEPETPAEGEVKWLSFVTGYLKPAIKHGTVDLWLDRLMPGGADWGPEIERKLAACDIFLLLVSRHSLSSDYVIDKEVALIRERQKNGEAVHFYPLVLTPTPKIALDLVRDKNLRPRDGKPFSDYTINDRFRHMNEAADEIADLANAIAARPAQGELRAAASAPPVDRPSLEPASAGRGAQPGDHDTLQRWMRRRHPDVVLTIAARAALRVAPLVFPTRGGPAGQAAEREFDDLLSAVLRALAPAQLMPQAFHADEFRPAFRAASDKGEAAARRAAHAVARAVCQSASDVAAAAATRFDDQSPRAAFAADAVTLAAEACARAAADHAALIVRDVPRRSDALGVDDAVRIRRRDADARAAATVAEGSGAAALWEEVQADLAWAEGFDPEALEAEGMKGRPLWAHGQPDWVRNVWSSLKAEPSLARRWEVWIAWYDERLRGIAREEAYEFAFAGAPPEEWDKGPAAVNGWVRQRLGLLHTPPPIADRETLTAWLEAQAPEVAVAIAARSALRAIPLLAAPNPEIGLRELEDAAAAVFRASALARVVARHGARADGFRAAAARAAATAAAQSAARAAPASARTAANIAADAARAADACARGVENVRAIAADAVLRAVDWNEVRSDAANVEVAGVRALIDNPVWSVSRDEITQAWLRLRDNLPGDHDWKVWIDWCEARLRGGARGEDYELVFASVPQDEWDKGPAAANAWIKAHLPDAAVAPASGDEGVIRDEESLRSWLSDLPREHAFALAARMLMRSWLCGSDRWRKRSAVRRDAIVAVFLRIAAMGRIAATYPGFVDGFREAAKTTGKTDAFFREGGEFNLVMPPIEAAEDIARAVSETRFVESVRLAASAVALAVETAGFAVDRTGTSKRAEAGWLGEPDGWAEVREEIADLRRLGAGAVSDLPLWRKGAPAWADEAWAALKAELPRGEDWDVWVDWFDDRLSGRSRGQDYEVPFATVPQEEWDKGPAAANAWIKERLPKPPETSPAKPLPAPVSGLDAPFSYGWKASERVAVVAGAQNLPDYRHFSSEEDHRRALEACRVDGERLLKAVRSGRYNARPEYGEALEYYLHDLPKVAGAGNILLANNQVRILHDLFLADAAMLSEGFASRLKSVIANQFALNPFYDIVQRHDEAVASRNWAPPFPLEAARGFFGAVEDNTPRWFEPQVEQGLRQVEQAEPPVVASSEPGPPPAIEPPPLPPGTPDAQNSWRRQMATAANALWDTFLQGQDLPVAQDEWRKTAEELGEHVRPLIAFLRAQDDPEK